MFGTVFLMTCGDVNLNLMILARLIVSCSLPREDCFGIRRLVLSFAPSYKTVGRALVELHHLGHFQVGHCFRGAHIPKWKHVSHLCNKLLEVGLAVRRIAVGKNPVGKLAHLNIVDLDLSLGSLSVTCSTLVHMQSWPTTIATLSSMI